MEALNKDIMEAIEKSLPAQVAGQLAAYIGTMKGLETRLEGETTERKRYEGNYLEASSKLEEFRKRESAIRSKEEDLARREGELKKKEVDAEIVTLKLANAQEKVVLVTELFKIPFQNRTLRESLYGSDSGVDQYGSIISKPMNRSVERTET